MRRPTAAAACAGCANARGRLAASPAATAASRSGSKKSPPRPRASSPACCRRRPPDRQIQLKTILDAQPDLEVLVAGRERRRSSRRSARGRPSRHPGHRLTGIQAAAELHKRKPELEPCPCTTANSSCSIAQGRRLGYVSESDADQDIVDGLPTDNARPVLYPSAIATLVRDYVERGRPDDEHFDMLTRQRELRVCCELIAEAHTSKQIATNSSMATGQRHRQNILDKLGRVARYAIRRGLIPP